jgi:hypothetical protein
MWHPISRSPGMVAYNFTDEEVVAWSANDWTLYYFSNKVPV